ncbi:eukaryotic translation initiation factor 5A-1 [Tanacetum coccineum]
MGRRKWLKMEIKMSKMAPRDYIGSYGDKLVTVWSKHRFKEQMDGTYEQEARTIGKGSAILIDDIPCKVTHDEYSDGEGDEYTSTFDAYDIFTREKHTHEYRAKDMCKCPFVHDSMYRIISISPEGRVRLQTHDGKPRIPLTLPSNLPRPHEPDSKVILDTDFVTHYRSKLRDGYKLFLVVKSAMGKEHICGITVKPKYPLVE